MWHQKYMLAYSCLFGGKWCTLLLGVGVGWLGLGALRMDHWNQIIDKVQFDVSDRHEIDKVFFFLKMARSLCGEISWYHLNFFEFSSLYTIKPNCISIKHVTSIQKLSLHFLVNMYITTSLIFSNFHHSVGFYLTLFQHNTNNMSYWSINYKWIL